MDFPGGGPRSPRRQLLSVGCGWSAGGFLLSGAFGWCRAPLADWGGLDVPGGRAGRPWGGGLDVPVCSRCVEAKTRQVVVTQL